MAVVLSVEFLAGRYHASPWDHHVNEGLVEWPPSPWRLLRALVAASYKLPAPPPRALLLGLLEALGETLPSYWLPPVVEAHTRHYMPGTGKNSKTSKVFDGFLAMDRAPDGRAAVAVIAWPETPLTEAQRALLAELCPLVGYLGRAESWSMLRLESRLPETFNAIPSAADRGDVRLLAPLSREGLEAFKQGFAVAAGLGPRRRKRDPVSPADLLDVLQLETTTIARQAWGAVPGARQVSYTRPPPRRQRRRQRAVGAPGGVQIVRYAISSTVPPRLKAALSLGDRVRKALMSRFKNDPAGVPSVLSGHGGDGQPLRDHHHIRILPEPGRGGRIGCIAALTTDPGGFDHRSLEALNSLHTIWGRDGFDLRLVLLEQTALAESSSALLAPARRWHSLTPFVPTRFPKLDRKKRPRIDPETGRWRMGPEDQLYQALSQAGLPEPASVEGIRDGKSAVGWHWSDFQFGRRGGGARGPLGGYGFTVTFSEPATGPISVGYGAHFGLGVFIPEID